MTTKSEEQSFVDATRGWGDILRLWRLCPRTPCARARACKGNVRDCFPRHDSRSNGCSSADRHGISAWPRTS